MLVQCPQCKTEFRLVDYRPDRRVIKYLCSGCSSIVQVDLELDEVRTSSSSGSYRALERRKTVLVADDAKQVQDLAEALLCKAGYRVLLASNGEEALKLIREQHPDLVLLDLLMPRMTGLDVLREMRQDKRIMRTPVLVMSGVYKDDILDFLLELGARDFLNKEQLRGTLVSRAQRLLTSELDS